MSEQAMNNEVGTEEFTDTLSDEALDREQAKMCPGSFMCRGDD